MGKKIWIEVCLLSARGLRRASSSLWKLQWYAVGWIHPHNIKYCTKIHASRKSNPVWKTAFSTALEFDDQPNFRDLVLHVEVYSRDPIFLRESLLGSATILLKEFLDKYYSTAHDSDAPKPVDEVGSFQLRKRSSDKPLGFVDVSIRISEEREQQPPTSSYLGGDEGFNLDNFGGEIKEGSGSDHGSLQPSNHHFPLGKSQQPQTTYQMPISPYYPHHPPVSGPNYPAATPRLPPPPPSLPPSNVGYIPNIFPMASNYTHSSYINMPSAAARGVGPAFATGVGAGALVAGAVIFRDDFMSGFDVAAAARRDASATISTYPPF